MNDLIKITPHDFEPKRNNRFIVIFPEQFNIESFVIQKINKPKFTDGKWENIKVDFIDPIGPSASQGLYKIINFLPEVNNENNELFNVKIISLDPIGEEIEECLIYDGEILTINFGDLDYGNDDFQKPYIIIKPLKCELK